MKSELNVKMLRIAVVEVLLQLGFEKCTEQSLNIVTEVFNYYLESLIKDIQPIMGYDENDKINFRIVAEKLFDDAYSSAEYEKNELFLFLEQQNSIIRMIQNGRDDDSDPSSLLHLLRLVPQGQSLRSIYKSSRTFHQEDENFSSSGSIQTEVELDAFLQTFIEHCEGKFNCLIDLKASEYSNSDRIISEYSNSDRIISEYSNSDRSRIGSESFLPTSSISQDDSFNQQSLELLYNFDLGKAIDPSGSINLKIDRPSGNFFNKIAFYESGEEQKYFLDEFTHENYKI